MLSGLGADERVFQKIRLPGHCTIEHIKWPAISKDETLHSYSLKIAGHIHTEEKFALLGLSFGGIMAVETAKHVNAEKIVLISCISVYTEMPAWYRLVGFLKIIYLIPSLLLNKIYPFAYWLFGAGSYEEKKLLKEIIHDTDPHFLKWALTKIITWKNTGRPINSVHIHGTYDKLFPARNITADIIIEGGGHFMIFNKAEQLNKILHLVFGE